MIFWIMDYLYPDIGLSFFGRNACPRLIFQKLLLSNDTLAVQQIDQGSLLNNPRT